MIAEENGMGAEGGTNPVEGALILSEIFPVKGGEYSHCCKKNRSYRQGLPRKRRLMVKTAA